MKKFKTQHSIMLRSSNYSVITETEFRRLREEDKQVRLIDSRKAISIARKFMRNKLSEEDILVYYETGKVSEELQESLGMYIKLTSLLVDIKGVYSPKNCKLYYKDIMEYYLKSIYDPEGKLIDTVRFILTHTLNFVEDEINIELETPNSVILKKLVPYINNISLFDTVPGINNAYTTNAACGKGGYFLIRLDNDYYEIPNEYLVFYRRNSSMMLVYKDGKLVEEGPIVEKCNLIKTSFEEKL